ncbi:hydroxybutyrate dehydrogenase [Penicillium lividum]|nr:hydroxybutyrate dehydrogenase [Penicillium lividum]
MYFFSLHNTHSETIDFTIPGQLTWLVTGCSSSLVEAFVRAILDKGDQVIATVRPSNGLSGVDRLVSLKEAGAATLELDVLAPQKELNAKAKET